MQIRELLSDDDAVSPVIGVILMVAITVILAAVIATFVLGLGDQVSNTAPQASFGTDYDEGTFHDGQQTGEDGRLGLTHDGGDSIKANELHVRGTPNDDGDWTTAGDSSFTSTEMISAGNGLNVDVSRDSTVRVVYEAEEGGNSATLSKWEGPDA